MSRLQALAAQFEIREDWVRRLRKLEGFSIVLVCDDSGSMATAVDPPPGANPYAPRATRWDELRNTAGIICEVAATCSSTAAGDVYFLNRPPMKAATGAAQLQAAFNFAPPQGFTPLARVFRQVLAENAAALTERKLLVVIATDGRPTNDAGHDDVPGFLQALRSMPRTCFVQIMACTQVFRRPNRMLPPTTKHPTLAQLTRRQPATRTPFFPFTPTQRRRERCRLPKRCRPQRRARRRYG